MLAPIRRSRPQEWLDNFFTDPHRPDQPNGAPLFTYQVTQSEYDDLVSILTDTAQLVAMTGPTRPWTACFAIFVAEYYRREYEGPWEWRMPEARIGAEFDQTSRIELTKQGIDYWKRPLRMGGKNNDYLGTLFAEGGLPWRRIHGGTSGFSNAVRAGLRHWHARESVGGDLVEHMSRFDRVIPIAFQNPGTHELMAGIVTELMRLASAFPLLENSNDPIGLLDSRAPGWRNRFPIPLGESNSHALIKGWLRDAAGEHQSRQRARNQHREPQCRTVLSGELPNWSLQSEVTLPDFVDFNLEGDSISNTRLQLTLHEGDRVAARVGTLYGELNPDAQCIRANFRERQFGVERRDIEQALALHAYSNGVLIGRVIIDQIDADLKTLPLIFDKNGEDWVLASATSTSVSHHQALVRVPNTASMTTPAAHEVQCVEEQGATWMTLQEQTDFQTVSGKIRIRPGLSEAPYCPVPIGIAYRRNSLPRLTWLGWPQLRMKDGSPVEAARLQYKLNGSVVAPAKLAGFVGRAQLIVNHKDHGVVLRRQIGVLPKDLRVSVLRATSNRPAQVVLSTTTPNLHVGVEFSGVSNTKSTQEGYMVEMRPASDKLPAEFNLNITGDTQTDPVSIRLPYPGEPARLVGPDGRALQSHDLVLDNLPGVRLLLTPPGSQSKVFYVEMELLGRLGRRLSMRLPYSVEGPPLEIPLDGLRSHFERMLSAQSDLDAHIRVRVETNSLLCEFSIRRFAARLRYDHFQDILELTDLQQQPVTNHATAQALSLYDPEQLPIALQERLSDGVGTGTFSVPTECNRDVPWLIYPSAQSATVFRPYLIEPSDRTPYQGSVASIQQAALQFDFQENRGIIDTVVETMATDFNHSGWRYLASLTKRYSHLPLSSFQAWKSVARCPAALVAVLMKMDLDRDFTRRFETELAVVWEQIPLHIWKSGIERYQRDLHTLALVPAMIPQIIEIKLDSLSDLLPALSDFLVGLAGNRALPPSSDIMVNRCLADWYQQLRRGHTERHWPQQLREPLDDWYQNQLQLPPIPALTVEHPYHVRPVCQLPLFMANLTMGNVSLSDLDLDEDAARFDIRLLSDFDRIWYESVYSLSLSHLVTQLSGEAQ